MYLVIQKGYALFGQGQTKEAAVKDANEWLEKKSSGDEWTADDFGSSYHQANDGELVLVELNENTESYIHSNQ
jgi:hypothetical protein